MRAIATALSLTEINVSRKVRVLEFIAYAAVAFAVPFLLGHPQLLVGSIVNASLVLAALNLKNYKILPIILLPSFAVLSRGLVFGPFTYLLVFTMPFIWVGNFMMVYIIKYFYVMKKMNKWLILILSIAAKVAFLYVAALVLIRIGLLPKVFATSMGVLQLYTAVIGTVLALSVQSIKKYFVK